LSLAMTPKWWVDFCSSVLSSLIVVFIDGGFSG
jgi:hypothetical protein